jgi:RHS repeat-associated protein
MIWRVIMFWLLGVNALVACVCGAERPPMASAVSNQATTFGYDAGGNRLWKQGAPTNTLQVWIGGNYEEKDGEILFHISAGDRMVCTFDSTGTNVFEYYHPDHLHSAQVMSSGLSAQLGQLYQHYEYGTYGNSRYTLSLNAFPVSRRYTSQVLDDETGLYYFGARYYDPIIGRFIQPDTAVPNRFDPQAYDRYAYTRDNPLEYVDPSGHAWQIFSGEYWKNLAHRMFIGGNGTPQLDPNSEQALANAAGQGPIQLTDENGNPVSGGEATIKVGMAVVNGVLQTGMAFSGEGEMGKVVKIVGEVVQGEKAVGTASKLEDTGTAGSDATAGGDAGASGSASASGTQKPPTKGALPNSTYTHIDPKTGKAVQNAIYDKDGNVVGHVDFKNHGPGAPSGHGHAFPEPGNPGSGHGPDKPHIPNKGSSTFSVDG